MRNVKEKYEKALGGIRAPQELRQKTMQAMLTEKQPQKKPPHRLLKSVAAGVVCAVFLCGMVVVPQMANQPKGNSFQIVAYAADNKKVALKKGEKVAVRRSEKETTDHIFDLFGIMSYNILQDNGDHLTIGVYCDPRIVCEGNNIYKITYSVTQENAGFAKVLWMSFQEYCKVLFTAPFEKKYWDYGESLRAAKEGEAYEKSSYPIDEKLVNPNYGNGGYTVELGGQLSAPIVNAKQDSDIYFSFLPVGKDCTVDYRDQDKDGYRYALRFTTTIPKKENENIYNVFSRFYYRDAIETVNGTKIKVTVTYDDETTETKEIQLNYGTRIEPETGYEYHTDLYITEL